LSRHGTEALILASSSGARWRCGRVAAPPSPFFERNGGSGCGLGAARRGASVLVANLEDLGSKNGTSLRGRPVMSVVELSDRDVITIGATVLVVRVADADAPTDTATGRAHN